MRWFCRERSQIQRQSRMRAAVPPGRREDWGNCGSKPAFQEISRLSRRVTVCAWGCPHRCGMGMVFPVVIGNKGGWGVARWLLSPRVSLPSGSCPILVSHVPAWSPVASPSPVSPVPIPVPHVQLLISHPSVLSQWLLSHPSAPCPILCPILSSPVPSWLFLSHLLSHPSSSCPVLVPHAPSWFLLSHPGGSCPTLMPSWPIPAPRVLSQCRVPSFVPSQCLLSHLSTLCSILCPILSPCAPSWCLMSHPRAPCPILVSPVPFQCPVSHPDVPSPLGAPTLLLSLLSAHLFPLFSHPFLLSFSPAPALIPAHPRSHSHHSHSDPILIPSYSLSFLPIATLISSHSYPFPLSSLSIPCLILSHPCSIPAPVPL
ncbi:leucine-rich repeat extensin-like protein 5 isoform X2 [Corvus hawaiiensis]|uniref:leucine-rich repeat extensin-like protein 5 isoform X2 n=1 Tax=Corvus hawaiiensis TaxID=134902 RepID=UPI0020197B6D|nr:leucine-rich repeat extensin-like protein 5 isoform X2 [Corvus hawaiiensis]